METTENSATPDVATQAAESHDEASKSPKESFAELRKAKEDLERQLWQAQKERELIQQQMQSQLQPKQQEIPEEDFDYRQLESEDFPDGKKLVKALSSMDKKMSKYEQKLAEKDHKLQALETALEFSDFKEVVTAENIEKYIKSDEDNLEAVNKASNPLRKVYNLIKKSAAYQAETAKKTATPISQEQKRVNDKESKPQINSIGVRSDAVTSAGKLTNSTMTRDQRNALWKETQAAARR
jgi:hypothetical protein